MFRSVASYFLNFPLNVSSHFSAFLKSNPFFHFISFTFLLFDARNTLHQIHLFLILYQLMLWICFRWSAGCMSWQCSRKHCLLILMSFSLRVHQKVEYCQRRTDCFIVFISYKRNRNSSSTFEAGITLHHTDVKCWRKSCPNLLWFVGICEISNKHTQTKFVIQTKIQVLQLISLGC